MTKQHPYYKWQGVKRVEWREERRPTRSGLPVEVLDREVFSYPRCAICTHGPEHPYHH